MSQPLARPLSNTVFSEVRHFFFPHFFFVFVVRPWLGHVNQTHGSSCYKAGNAVSVAKQRSKLREGLLFCFPPESERGREPSYSI